MQNKNKDFFIVIFSIVRFLIISIVMFAIPVGFLFAANVFSTSSILKTERAKWLKFYAKDRGAKD